MKKFTKSLLTLVLLCAVSVANAVTEQKVHECDYSTKNSYPWYRMGTPNGSSFDVENGTLVITNPVEQTNNYDLQPFIDDNISANSGDDYIIRLTYKTTVAGKITLNMGTWSAGKSVEVSLSVSDEFQTVDGALSEYNTTAQNIHILLQMGKLVGTVTVQKVELIYLEPDDPLLVPKKALQAAIDGAEAKTNFGKTESGYAAFLDVLSDAKAALAAAESKSALESATETLKQSLKNIPLQDGYVYLTTEMFKNWDKCDVADVTVKGNAGCGYKVCEEGEPYGDGNVGEYNFANLDAFDYFYIPVSYGIPRVMMNRTVANGQFSTTKAESKLLEMPKDGSWTDAYYTKSNDGKLFTYDIKKIIDENGFAHLNAIKGANWQPVMATDLILYASPRVVTVGAAGYATFSSELNTKVSGTKAYAAKVNGNKVVLTEVTEIPAGSGVIVETEGSYQFPVLNEAEAIADNDLLVSDGTVTGDGSIYVLNQKNDKVGFYQLAEGKKLEAGKAYLKLENSARGFIGIEEATGINEVNVNKAAAKTGKIYNLNGQIVSKPSKGLFIVDGKVVSF